MTYTAIPDSDIDADSPITTALMTLLRNNPIAIAAGDAGAPSIATAAIAASAVSQSKLKTTTQEVTQNTQTVGEYSVELTSIGEYGFVEKAKNTSAAPGTVYIYITRKMTASDSTYRTYAFFNVTVSAGAASTGYVQSRYVQSSPPYGIEGEDWPLFVMLRRRKSDGAIVSVTEAEDPIWCNMLPNIGIRVGGSRFVNRAIMSVGEHNFNSYVKELISKQKKKEIDDLIAALSDKNNMQEIIITKEYKNTYMNECQHPWAHENNTDYDIIILEPRRTDKIKMMKEAGVSICELVNESYIKITDEVHDHVKPDSVKCCAFKLL